MKLWRIFGQVQNKETDCKFVLCPVCGNKTRTKIQEDTEMKNFPLYCPKCKKETVSDTGNCTALITILRSKKKTAPTMRFTVCRGRKKSQRGTRNYPLSALDLTGHLKHRVRWGLCAGQQEKRWRDWRTSTSICSDTPIQAICFQTVQHLKMCRNFLDTLMSVPQ